MEGSDGAAGAVGFSAIVRKHQRRASVALDYTRGRDADDAAMPTVAVDHHAIRVVQRWFLFEAGLDGLQNTAFFFLALAVELIEAPGDFAGALRVFHAEKL